MKRFLAPALAVALVALGCPPALATPLATPSADTTSYYAQSLRWSNCGGGFQCATATAPLHWSKPKDGSISLSLIRQRATGPKRIGSLLVNPGGPGGSGVDFVRGGVSGVVSAAVQKRFDVVGFDPRGVGRSTPVSCLSDRDLSRFLYFVPEGARGSASWLAATKQAQRQFARGCAAHSGALLGAVDTVSAARDLDLLRALLGDAKLNYLGYSYGTFLGATYAGLFPKRVGKLVLDGAVDPAASYDAVGVSQAQGFESALRAFVAHCLGQSNCPLDRRSRASEAKPTVASAMSIVRSLLTRADSSPLLASDGRELGGDTLFTAIAAPLYSAAAWPVLQRVLSSVLSGSADVAFAVADSYNTHSPGDNSAEAFRAITCADYPVDASPAAMARQRARLEAAAPTLGTYFAYGEIGCGVWPVPAVRTPAPIHAPGSSLIVVVGTTNDPATPYHQAVSLARELGNATLITFRGEGHTAYGQSTCVQAAVDAYLLRGSAPRAGLTCST